MSWHYSLELVAEFLDRFCLDTGSCARLSSIRTAERSCFDDKKTRSYRRSLSGMMYDHSTASRGVAEWISCLLDFRVNHGALLANEPGNPTREICGRRPSESFARWDQESSSWKTYPACFDQTFSVEFFGTWPRAGMMRGGIAYRHPSSARISSATASGSLPRVPRPSALDYKGSGRKRVERSHNLNWRDWWNVNYGFVYPPVKVTEYMMGWPIGWTDLKPLGMDKYHEWLRSHGKD